VNDAAWWARAVQARAERDDLRPQRMWTLRKRVPRGPPSICEGGRHWCGDRAHGGRPSGGRPGCSGRTSRRIWCARRPATPQRAQRSRSAVAISGSTLIVGMQFNAHGKRSGAAYVFERRRRAWAEVARLSSTGSAPQDLTGDRCCRSCAGRYRPVV
jgi:hypothetical protein